MKSKLESQNEMVAAIATNDHAAAVVHQQESEHKLQELPRLIIKKISLLGSEGRESTVEAEKQNENLLILSSLLSQLEKEKVYQMNSSIGIRRSLTKRLSFIDEKQLMEDSIEVSSLVAWFLLFLNAINNAVVPCWMTVDIISEGFTRNSWRFLFLSIFLIPFVMYEQRQVREQSQRFKRLLTKSNLKILFLCSLNYCMWTLCGFYACKLTSRCHSFCLLRIKFFLVALFKIIKGIKHHEIEVGGSVCVLIGICMIFWDSIDLPQTTQFANMHYLSYGRWQRFFGDCLAIGGSALSAFLDTKYSLPKNPRFSNFLMYNLMITITLMSFGYVFGGSSLSFDARSGAFGLFTDQNFVGVFYVSIMLGLNLMIGNVLVDKIFSEVIRNVASCFEIIITTMIYHIFDIEVVHSGMTCLGFSFLVPGMMLIVGGQNQLQNKEFKIDLELYKQDEIELLAKRKQMSLVKENLQNLEDIEMADSRISFIEQSTADSELKHKNQ